MVTRSILTKIQPLDTNESCFYETLVKTKSVELEPRSLTFSFLNEETSFAEASALASSAISWLENLESEYNLFESKAKYVTISDESAFIQYCLKKGWSVKKNSKDLIARQKDQFKAKFELSSNKVYMIYNSTDPLARMQLLNDYGED